MRRIYFDHNATTPLDPEVKATIASLEGVFGNPSSIHWAGREARRVLNDSREKIARLLEAKETEILFTSGGTESINMALVGMWESKDRIRNPESRVQIISSPVEHNATLKSLEYLKTRGAQIVFLKVDRKGRIDLAELREKMGPQTLLVSIMWANNEVGNLYPIEEIAGLCRERGSLFHCDGVQALGKIPLSLKKNPIDLLSFSAHKFHGPKGVGGLFVRDGLPLAPFHHGGSQEKGLRGGTENLHGISGMASALERTLQDLDSTHSYLLNLRKRLEGGILEKVDRVRVNGDEQNRLPNTTNVLIEGVDGESLLFNLDLEGIAASAGSACASGSIDPSHVLLAMGLSPREAKASLRLSLSKFNTGEEVDTFLEKFPRIVQRLRK